MFFERGWFVFRWKWFPGIPNGSAFEWIETDLADEKVTTRGHC